MNHERDSLERAVQTEKISLISFLSNPLILQHTVTYLPVASLLSLAATNKSFHELVHHTPSVFRYFDLSTVKSAQFESAPIDQGGEIWRNVQLDENLTENEFYSGPLTGIFASLQRKYVLQNIQTLILDGLSVTAELVHDILLEPSFNVRILSIRGVQNLNHRRLQQSLQYACRAARPDPENTPRLKALYVFGNKDDITYNTQPWAEHQHHGAGTASTQTTPARPGEVADAWYGRRGTMIRLQVGDGWAETLHKCASVIAFDAPLCTGPRHINTPAYGVNPYIKLSENKMAVATVALGGCSGCGKAPEGLSYHSNSSGRQDLPVLAPVPALSSTLKAAKKPVCAESGFVGRCFDCIRDRYCAACHQWWCESCYLNTKHMASQGPVVVNMDLDSFVSSDEFNASFPEDIPQVRFCLECKRAAADYANWNHFQFDFISQTW